MEETTHLRKRGGKSLYILGLLASCRRSDAPVLSAGFFAPQHIANTGVRRQLKPYQSVGLDNGARLIVAGAGILDHYFTLAHARPYHFNAIAILKAVAPLN